VLNFSDGRKYVNDKPLFLRKIYVKPKPYIYPFVIIFFPPLIETIEVTSLATIKGAILRDTGCETI
jgi:hypothetical protein